jgi:peptidoglycan/LPS O-acetylase OafA/YrhL
MKSVLGDDVPSSSTAAHASPVASPPPGESGAPSAGAPLRLGRQPALDGLRGIAIVAVVLHHWHVPGFIGGYLGVDLFFVLSGFLITALLLQELGESGRVDLRNFYVRRTLRLLPALVVLLVIFGGYMLLRSSPEVWRARRDAIVSVLFYFANWRWALAPTEHDVLGPLLHTWSLSVEEQFYLFWPPLLLGLMALGAGRRVVLGTLAVLILACGAWRIALLQRGVTDVRLFAGTDTRIDSLLVGCALAVLLSGSAPLVDAERTTRAHVSGLGALVVLGFLIAVVPMHSRWLYLGGQLLVAMLGAGLIYGALRGSGPLVAGLSWMPLRWFGTLSYSLYLWHYPLIAFGRQLGVMRENHPTPLRVLVPLGIATLLCAWGSFQLVERPFLRMRGRFQPRSGPGRAPTPR